MVDEKYLIIKKDEYQKTYRQLEYLTYSTIYKLTNTVIQNEPTIPIIEYFYKSRILRIIDKLEIYFDPPKAIEFPLAQLINRRIDQVRKLFCTADTLVNGNKMGEY